MNRFTLGTILVLILLLVGGGIYYSNKTAKLEKILWEQADIIADTTYSDPELTGMTSASVSKQDGVLVPKIIYRDTGSIKTVKVPITVYDTIREVDTVEVLVDYFSLKTYMDSITSQDVEIKVFDTLQKNSIFARSYSVINLRTEESFKKRMVYIGGNIGLNREQVLLGPSLSYLDKKGNMFGGTYLLNFNQNSLDRLFMFNYSKKITLKKRTWFK